MLKLYEEEKASPEALDDLLRDAGEEDFVPPAPPGGIPKQWLPGWIRWPLRVCFLPLILLDLFAQRVARSIIKPPLKQVGQCKKRGNCCYYILIPAAKGIVGKLFYLWNTQVLGFYRRDDRMYEYENKPIYVMGCRYLQKDGTCGHYRLRPAVCRKWPIIEYFGHPRVLKGCGFKAAQRDNSQTEG